MSKRFLGALCLSAFMAACIGAPSGGPSSPTDLAAEPPSQPTAAPAAQAPEGTGSAGGVCYLVTDSEIGSIMGRQPILGGSGFEMGGIRSCTWVLYMDPMESVGIQLSRAVNHEDGRIFDHAAIPGLGDDAYWVTDPNLPGLYARQGAHSLYVSVTSESADLKSAAISITRLALSRLPR